MVSHMMPDLPNVDFERDVEQFIEFFENPAFRADGMFSFTIILVTERIPETRVPAVLWRNGLKAKRTRLFFIF